MGETGWEGVGSFRASDRSKPGVQTPLGRGRQTGEAKTGMAGRRRPGDFGEGIEPEAGMRQFEMQLNRVPATKGRDCLGSDSTRADIGEDSAIVAIDGEISQRLAF